MKYFSAANGIYQNSVFGMVAKLPTKYTGAVILGSVNKNLNNFIQNNKTSVNIYIYITLMLFSEYKWNIYSNN